MASDGPTIAATTLAPITRSEVWFEDGNVVLQAERKQFKIHRGTLARASSVFRDMFTLPQPPISQEETVEGCIVVQLSDSAADLEIVLQALIERGFAASRDPVSTNVVAAFLRLGRKYDFEVLRVEALRRIFYETPTTLEAFDKMQKWSQIQSSPQVALWPEIVQLAHEQNLQSVLPFALYMCCTGPYTSLIGPSIITRTYNMDDGRQFRFRRTTRSGNYTTYAWLKSDDPYESCEQTLACAFRRTHFLRQHFFNHNGHQGLATWEGCTGSRDPDFGLRVCEYCEQVAYGIHADGRRSFWEGIPKTLNLPPWEELREERAECLKAK
ncbi:hypothetical protein FIBSPDRAFT_930520 [Athelia psychrophila]|uniref:BTB domain-containing protein n=1 Tax=Athelia psychrophila TaxID=1759441 RepID=A0A166LY82_9AGAM|nr:hypothetical protein FIBSPDRAFT_930520 [Fibularhizoctonia sp. CBS 109695]